MDASQDVWDWEVLPESDHRSFSVGHGSKNLDDDQETMEPVMMAPSGEADVHEPVVDVCKDIGVVPDETIASKEETMPTVTDPLASDREEEEEKLLQLSPDAKEADDEKFAEVEEEDVVKEDDGEARPECVVFSVGKLMVNGIGALCPIGVAAATVCIFLIGGRVC